MSMVTIGTCGNCGGPVQSPMYWGSSEPPPKRCARCGATPAGEFGPVLPMTRKKSRIYDSDLINESPGRNRADQDEVKG